MVSLIKEGLLLWGRYNNLGVPVADFGVFVFGHFFEGSVAGLYWGEGSVVSWGKEGVVVLCRWK